MGQKFLRTLFLVIFSTLLYQNGFCFSFMRASTGVTIPVPVAKDPAYLKASVFVKLSPREFASATGKKLNFFQKIHFKIIQRQLKHDLKKNPDLLITEYFDQKNGKFKFSLLWFIIAAFIGPLGVLFAYTSPHQKKDILTRKDKTTSAWLGFLFFVLWFGWLFVF